MGAITAFAGPIGWAGTGVFLTLGTIANFGCDLFAPGKTQEHKTATQSEVTAREPSVKWEDLSGKDQRTVTEIWQQSNGDQDEARKNIKSNLSSGSFDNAVDSIALLQKKFKDPSIF